MTDSRTISDTKSVVQDILDTDNGPAADFLSEAAYDYPYFSLGLAETILSGVSDYITNWAPAELAIYSVDTAAPVATQTPVETRVVTVQEIDTMVFDLFGRGPWEEPGVASKELGTRCGAFFPFVLGEYPSTAYNDWTVSDMDRITRSLSTRAYDVGLEAVLNFLVKLGKLIPGHYVVLKDSEGTNTPYVR